MASADWDISRERGQIMYIALCVIPWALLALAVLAMAIYRNLLGIHERALHVARGTDSAAAVEVQLEKERRVEKLDYWGQRLTLVVAAWGWFWQWVTSTTLLCHDHLAVTIVLVKAHRPPSTDKHHGA